MSGCSVRGVFAGWHRRGAKHPVPNTPFRGVGTLARVLLMSPFKAGAIMARPIRMLNAAEIFFVTVRCYQRRYLLRPSTDTNELLGGVLARAVRLHGVELFAFSIISNHIHLLVRAPRGNLPRFMQYLATNVSKKVGRLVRWGGSFWGRRYAAEPILDETALLGRLRYVLSHGVKEGLVRRCRDWPGLSCSARKFIVGFGRRAAVASPALVDRSEACCAINVGFCLSASCTASSTDTRFSGC